MRINQTDYGPLHLPQSKNARTCDHFIFAHAPSRVVFKIPYGTLEFKSFAYNTKSLTTKFIVEVSNSVSVTGPLDSQAVWLRIFESEPCGWQPISVKVPASATFLRLVVDDMGSQPMDHSFWLRPTYYSEDGSFPLTKSMQVGGEDAQPFHFGYEQPAVCWFSLPVDADDYGNCDEFLWGHLNSKITFEVPDGFQRFTAIAGSTDSRARNTELKIALNESEVPAYYAVSPAWEQIDLALPPGTTSISLIAQDLSNETGRTLVWAYPRLHRSLAAPLSLDELTAGTASLKPLRVKMAWPGREFLNQLQALDRSVGSWRVENGCPRGNEDSTGRQSIYCLHPPNENEPATVDFGAITGRCRGLLTLHYRNLDNVGPDQSDHRLIIKRNGIVVHDIAVKQEAAWKRLELPFDHQYLSMEHWALGWNQETGLYDFEIVATTADGQHRDMLAPLKASEPLTPIDDIQSIAPTEVVSGNWQILPFEGEATLVQTDFGLDADGCLVFGDSEWTHYDLSFKVRRERGTHGFRVYLHWQDGGQCAAVGVGNGYNGYHDLTFYADGRWQRGAKINLRRLTGDQQIQPRQWYDVKIEVRGATVECYLNGEQILQGDLFGFEKGRVALASHDAALRFKDILVTDAIGDQSVLYKGLPRLVLP